MSYGRGDFGDSASQLGTSPLATGGSSSATMDYQRLTSVVASNTTKIGQNNKEITRLAQDIGTERDGASVRDQLQQRQQATRKLCKDTERFLKELKALPSPEQESERRQRRVMLTKLANTFSNCLNEFQKAQRESLEKEKMAMKSQSTNEEKNHLINMENTGQVQVQQQLSQEEYAAMQERENAIAQLEADIADVNMIFKDLASMVHDQGEIIDSIETNIENAVVDIQQGNTQLRQARDHQRSARKKKFVIAGICLIFILVLFLIIYFSIPSSS